MMADAKISTPVAYASSGVTVLLGLTVNEWLAVGAFATAAATFVVNWYHRRRDSAFVEKRETLECEALHLDIERKRLELEGVKFRKVKREEPQHDE
jgi:hypothetical protein